MKYLERGLQKKTSRGRSSFGFGYYSASDSLLDPGIDECESRRSSSLSRLEGNLEEDQRRQNNQFNKQQIKPSPLDPNCADFLVDGKYYDGTRYPRTQQDMEVASGVSIFSSSPSHYEERQGKNYYDSTSINNQHQRDQPPLESHADEYKEHNENQAKAYRLNNLNDGRPNKNSMCDDDYGVHETKEKEQNNEATVPSPYQARRLNLQINTEREDHIDVTASEERLRLAGNIATSNFKTDNIGGGHQHTLSLTPKPMPVDAIYQEKSESVLETVWRDFISDAPGAKYSPESGRYHLYASYACPGSHRALIVRALKGLEDVISVTIVHPTWRHTNPSDASDKHRGWVFGNPEGKPFHNTMGRGGPFPSAYPDNTPDPILNAFSVRNLYEYASDTSGKYTIPLLWDKKLNTIVNNESSDISYMLNSSFNDFAKQPDLDLYTEDDEDGLDRLNEVSQWLYPMMIHGVYRCGFAKSQRAYDQAIEELTEAFDAADEILQQQRYLTGDVLTDADIRLFVTLLRFDEVYAFYFRSNSRLVLMTPTLLNFTREIYQMPGVAATCHMDQIKAHFFGSHAEWNKYSVIPCGLNFMKYLEIPHDRNNLSYQILGNCDNE